ncbi:MAG TPA: glycosyltransferase family 1 protein [bacterium]|nr:glycosyltransferase family 1 protein [bacterium]
MNTIKIGIDAHSIGLKQGGNERYAEGLLKGISEIETNGFAFTIFLNRLADIPDFIKNIQRFHIERVSVSPLKRLVFDISFKAKYLGLDMLHTQYHLPFFTRIPSVITLHDVSYLRHPEFFPVRERLKMRMFMPVSIKKAKKIITVSHFSKNEILKFHPSAKYKLTTVYYGVSENFKPLDNVNIEATLNKYGIARPYILAVSNIQPRKNLNGLLKAFVTLCQQQKDFPCRLVIAGRKLWLYNEIFSEIRRFPVADKIILTDYLKNDELSCLYNGAEMSVYISFYEGFGLPALEAMACGCPVIVSDNSSLPEIVGDAGMLVDPYNVNELASVIKNLFYDKTLRGKLKQKGIEQAKKFSWRKCATETVEIYKQVLLPVS